MSMQLTDVQKYLKQHPVLRIIIFFIGIALIARSIVLILPYFRGREYLDQQRDKRMAQKIYNYITSNSIKSSLSAKDVEIIFSKYATCTGSMISETQTSNVQNLTQEQIRKIATCLKENISNTYTAADVTIVINAFNAVWTTNKK